MLLRGLNRSGLEYSEPSEYGFLEASHISEPEISCIVRDWGAQVIRVPFNQDWALNGRHGWPASAYLDAIDRVIAWTAAAGAYTLLDLQWLDADVPCGLNADGTCNRVPSLPNLDSIRLWIALADRYRTEPAVLFDIFNEPHDPIPGDRALLVGIREDGATFPIGRQRVTMAEWQPWARHLVHAIRRAHPESLIFVPGVRWAYDLRGMPLTISAGSGETFRNVVYATHVYPWCSRSGLSWPDAFGDLACHAPVFMSEWGGGPEHLEWGRALVEYATALGIGWTAWSWSDRPRLVRDAQAQCYEPTEFGRLVREALKNSEF